MPRALGGSRVAGLGQEADSASGRKLRLASARPCKAPRSRVVPLAATELPESTPTAAGKASLDMLGVLAELAANLRRERQAGRISAA